MATTTEHPLEMLYQARDALEKAVDAVGEQPMNQVSDELCCYAAVNTAILHEFRTLADVLATKLDNRRPAVRAAHGEIHELISMFDEMIAYIRRHQPTITDLRQGARLVMS